MAGKRYARDPLLYIEQPSIKTPLAPMQANYMTPKRAKETVSTEQKVEKPLKSKTIKRDFFESKAQAKNENDVTSDETGNKLEMEETDTNQNINETQTEEKADRPKFKDMTLDEKVDYFVNLPQHIPKMKCEVKTEENTYRGVIVNRSGENVLMRLIRRTSNTKIPFAEIQQINLLGF